MTTPSAGRPSRRPVVLPVASELAGLRRRMLPFSAALGQSLGTSMPASMALVTPMALLPVAGKDAWLSVLLGAALMWLVRSTVVQFSQRLSAPGSLFTYAAQGRHPLVALVVAVAMLVAYGMLAAWALTRSAVQLSRLTAPDRSASPTHELVLLVVIIVVVAAGMLLGVKVSAHMTLVAEIASITVLVGIVAFSVAQHDTAFSLDLAAVDWSRTLAGAVVFVTVLEGFEAAAALSAETSRPFRNVPRAMSASLAAMAVLCLVAVLLGPQAVVPRGTGAGSSLAGWWFPLSSDHATADLAIETVRLVSFVGCALASWAVVSRLVFTLARAGAFPRAWGATSRAFRTPSTAIVLSGLAVASPGIAAFTLSDHASGISAILDSTDSGFVLMYGLVCACLPGFLRRIDEPSPWAVLAAWTGAAGMAAVLVVEVVGELRDGEPVGLLIACACVGLGVAWWAVLRRRGDLTLAQLRINDTATSEDVHPVSVGR